MSHNEVTPESGASAAGGAASPAAALPAASLDAAADLVVAEAARLDELTQSGAKGEGVGLSRLLSVSVRVTVEVGRARIPLGELVKLAPGSIVELDREAHEPADVLVNGKVVARGEIVTVGSHYGVRISSLVSPG
jgi:flagellar motor switch protein FliN/FliY